MSSLRRPKSVAVASEASSRLRSRMTCCDCPGLDQRLGSEIVFSTSLSFWRRVGASKILLELAKLIFHGSVFAFEFFNHKISRPHRHGTTANRRQTPSAEGEAHKQTEHRNYRTPPGKPIGAASREFADLIGKDGFVAYEGA